MKTDVRLQRDVMDELNWEPSVEAAQIGLTAKEGVVTLTGHVPVYSQKHCAEVVAKRVHGVRAVANEIEVRPTDVHQRDDEDIAAAAVHALQWDAEVPDENVQIVVDNGWVTVDGNVEERFQKSAIERVLRHLTGVRGITNSVTVTPQEVHSELKSHIEAAFSRSATLNSGNLEVVIDGPTVILTGDVHSHAELEEAERTAWSAQGVLQVQNCLTITPWGVGPAEEWGY